MDDAPVFVEPGPHVRDIGPGVGSVHHVSALQRRQAVDVLHLLVVAGDVCPVAVAVSLSERVDASLDVELNKSHDFLVLARRCTTPGRWPSWWCRPSQVPCRKLVSLCFQQTFCCHIWKIWKKEGQRTKKENHGKTLLGI